MLYSIQIDNCDYFLANSMKMHLNVLKHGSDSFNTIDSHCNITQNVIMNFVGCSSLWFLAIGNSRFRYLIKIPQNFVKL